jgi:hypothetical protein
VPRTGVGHFGWPAIHCALGIEPTSACA